MCQAEGHERGPVLSKIRLLCGINLVLLSEVHLRTGLAEWKWGLLMDLLSVPKHLQGPESVLSLPASVDV